MASNDDENDNVVPFAPRFDVTLEEDTLFEADIKSGMSYFIDKYDMVAVVAWNEEDGRLDILSQEADPAALYELLQQAAANVALEAIEESFKGSYH